MRNFWILFIKEIRSFFISPIAYLVLGAFSLINGYTFNLLIQWMTDHHERSFTLVQAMVSGFLFWFVIMIQAPVITMRSLSEEYKLGTIEMLLTAPVREIEIVLAKFAAAMVFFCLLWICIPLDLAFVQLFSTTPSFQTWGMSTLPLAMILLLGCFYVSVGLFTSALTKNQILAAIFSFAIIFLSFCVGFANYADPSSPFRGVFSYLSAPEHMDTFSRGILDTRPIALFVSATAFFLFLTQRVLEGRRLRS